MAFCDDPTHHWVRDTWAVMRADTAMPDDQRRRRGDVVSARRPLGIGVRRPRLDGPGPQPSAARIPALFPERCFDPVARRLRRPGAERRSGDSAVRVRVARPDWRDGDRGPGGRRLCGDRAEHAARARSPSPRSGGQGRVLREAGRRHAGPGRRRRRARDRRRTWSPASATTTAGRRSFCTPGSSIASGGSARSPTTAAGSCRCTAPTRSALSWRFHDRRGRLRGDVRPARHSVDLAHMLVGPISEVSARGDDVHQRAPAAGRRHPLRPRQPGRPTGPVTNEDCASMLSSFANGARGTFEASRTMVGPESQNAFDVYGTNGALALELRAAQRAAGVPRRRDRRRHPATPPLFGGDRYATTARSCPAAPTRSASRTWSRSRTSSSRRSPRAPPSPRASREAVEVVACEQALIGCIGRHILAARSSTSRRPIRQEGAH